MLAAREGASLFKVVETNDFNQLPHVSLAFRPGGDATVKQFLAGRLAELRAANARLEASLARTQVGPLLAAAGHPKVAAMLAVCAWRNCAPVPPGWRRRSPGPRCGACLCAAAGHMHRGHV